MGAEMCIIDGLIFFFQAEDGIRGVERSRGLGMCIRDRLKPVVTRRSERGEKALGGLPLCGATRVWDHLWQQNDQQRGVEEALGAVLPGRGSQVLVEFDGGRAGPAGGGGDVYYRPLTLPTKGIV